MEAFILGSLGQYTNLVVGLALTLVVLLRKSIRKRHITVLLAIAVACFIAYFALLLWGFTWYRGQKSVAMFRAGLSLLAGAVVGCGSAIGFSFVLKSLGLASLTGDESSAARGRRR